MQRTITPKHIRLIISALLGESGLMLNSATSGLGAMLLLPAIALAGVDVCDQPDEYSRLSLGYFQQDDSGFDENPGRLGREDRFADLQYKANDRWSVGIRHRYAILDVEPGELQTNGHLHTLSFPAHRRSGSDEKGFRFSIAPTLSASSNVMKDPGEFTADTFQLLAAALWNRQLSSGADLRYGLCADHRFGEYAIYPSITLAWRPHPHWLIELGFPMTRMSYQVSSGVTTSLRIAPDGNEWHVKSRDLERQSQLVHEALQLRWAFDWQASEHIGLSVAIARLFRSRYNVTLVDDTRAGLDLDTATRVGAAVEWRF